MRKDCQCPRARHEHGTNHAYVGDRCRCPECVRAHTMHTAHRRKLVAYGRFVSAYVPAVGTARRLEALSTLGWSIERIAARVGVPSRILVSARHQNAISRSVAVAVAAVYDELWNVQPVGQNKGDRVSINRTKALARHRGYLPPLAWDDDTIDEPNTEDYARDLHTSIAYPSSYSPSESADLIDEIAVEQAMNGRRVPLNRAETSEAIARLTRMGIGAEEIAERLGISSRTVVRFRSQGESVAA